MNWEINFKAFSSDMLLERTAKGLTKNEASKKIGISEPTYSKMEGGEGISSDGKGCGMQTFMLICNWLQVEPYRYFSIKFRKPDKN